MPSKVKEELADLEAAQQRRQIRSIAGPQGREVELNGQNLLNFSSNDTLGLANHPDLLTAARAALDSHGLGAGAARLLCGSSTIADELETELADWLGAERVLLFSSGYHANLGVLSTLTRPDRHLFSDHDNHASLIDGARLGKSARTIYPHFAPPLERLAPGDLVVTESVFSMEGRPMPERLVEDVQRRGAHAIVDEAHALGWAGPSGAGLAGPGCFCRIGTFGKAFGSFGAFVASSVDVIDLLTSKARTFIFTTALPPVVVAASLAALRLIRSSRGTELREQLGEQCRRVREVLGSHVIGEGPIFSLTLGSESAALHASQMLLKRGLLISPIRPPTVPAGTSRLRIVLSAAHKTEDVTRLLDAVTPLLAA